MMELLIIFGIITFGLVYCGTVLIFISDFKIQLFMLLAAFVVCLSVIAVCINHLESQEIWSAQSQDSSKNKEVLK